MTGKFRKLQHTLVVLAVLTTTAVVAAQISAQSRKAKTGRAHTVISQALQPLDGQHLKVTLVEVGYAPGEASPPHTHPCPVIGYVTEGSIQSQVKGQPERTYKVGESFYEPANGVHQVSRNASKTRPAKLLAYFVCDHDAPLTSPVSIDRPHREGK